MTPVVTPVRVCVQHGVDRDLQLGTEHRTRVQRAYFTVEGAPVVTLYGLRGYCVIRLVAAASSPLTRRSERSVPHERLA